MYPWFCVSSQLNMMVCLGMILLSSLWLHLGVGNFIFSDGMIDLISRIFGLFTLSSPLPYGIFLFKNGMIDMVSRVFFYRETGLVFFGICEENDGWISHRRKWTGVRFDDGTI